MLRTRLVMCLLATLVVSAAGALGSASASAAQETRFFVEGKEVNEPNETVAVYMGSEKTQINYNLAGEELKAICRFTLEHKYLFWHGLDLLVGFLEQCQVFTDIADGVQEYEGCIIPHIPIYIPTRLIVGRGGQIEDELYPNSGNTLFEFTLENESGKTCIAKGKYKAEGTYLSSWGDEAERSKPEHELVLDSTGSKMTINGSPASLTSTVTLATEKGQPWAIG
jgi:hypothetical protein